MIRLSFPMVVASLWLQSDASAQVQISYKAEDAYAQMEAAIRMRIEPTPVPGNFFSITAIGAVAEKDDPNAINELANFCPDVSKQIVRFGGVRPIDLLYEKAIDSMVPPVFVETEDVKEAKAFLRGPKGSSKSEEYSIYIDYLEQSTELLKKMNAEKDQGALEGLLLDYRNLQKDWEVQGYKGEVQSALYRIDAGDGLFGPVHNFHRKEVLTAFRDHGLTAQWQIGSFKSPVSEVSPPP